MRASIDIDGVKLLFSDHSEEMIGPYSPGSINHISFYFKNVVREKLIFDALSEGGRVTTPLANQFWNSYFRRLVNKFGIH